MRNIPEKLESSCFYGQKVKCMEVSNFCLTESTYHPHRNLPKHFHENSYFCFVLKGIYSEKQGKNEIIAKPFTVSFLSAGQTHEDCIHSQEVRVLVIEIPSCWIERLKEESVTINSTLNFHNSILPKLSARLYQEFYREDNSSLLAIEGIIYEMLAEGSRQSKKFSERKIPRWLKFAHDFLTEHFAENLSLLEIASQVNVHPIYLSTVFKQKFGCNVGDFTRRLKIENACKEILKDELSMANIALESGFSDQSHFCKIFKNYTGLTPAAYKKTFLYSSKKS